MISFVLFYCTSHKKSYYKIISFPSPRKVRLRFIPFQLRTKLLPCIDILLASIKFIIDIIEINIIRVFLAFLWAGAVVVEDAIVGGIGGYFLAVGLAWHAVLVVTYQLNYVVY